MHQAQNFVGSSSRGTFNLLRWFSVGSLLSVTAISVACAIFLSSYLKDSILQRDAQVSMEIINSIVRAQKAASSFSTATSSPVNDDLKEFLRQIAHLPGVLGANVYSADRRVIWSNNDSLIGKMFLDNDELEHALAGALNTEIEIIEKGEKQEHAFLEGAGDAFIENYLPIWDDRGTRVVGVVELYRTPDSILAVINNGQRATWLGALFAGLFLFGTLYWIAHRGNRLIVNANKKLVESERLAAIGETAAAVAHGFRNPLASIRSSAELVLDDKDDESSTECLQDIVKTCDRLAGWISGFLVDAQEAGTKRELVRVNEAVVDSLQTFVEQMQRTGVAVEAVTLPEHCSVEANGTALRQVFNSIISNSIEAMPDGGSLRIESAQDEESGAVSISFLDTGTGLKTEKTAASASAYATTKTNGMGVGLPIARRIVERLGGAIELSNRTGRGTVVTVRLPVAA